MKRTALASYVTLILIAALLVSCFGGAPEPTATPAPTNTPIPPTATAVPPTDTPVPPTDTPVPPTDTPVPPTDTPVPPTATTEPTPEPTATPEPTLEPTATTAPSPEPTEAATAEPSPEATAAATTAPAATVTGTPGATVEAAGTPEVTGTVAASPEPTEELTVTPEATEEVTGTPEATEEVTPEVTGTPAVTAEVTEAPEATIEVTGTPEATAEGTPEMTGTPKATEEVTGTPEATEEVTGTPEATEEATGTPEATEEVTGTPEPTGRPTRTPRPTREATGTPKATEEVTGTPEATKEVTGTPEATPEVTGTPGALELVPFTDDTMGIKGVVPEGWEAVGPGIYLRPDDPITRIIQQVAPGATRQQVAAALLVQLGLKELPEPVETLETKALSWDLYEVEVDVPALGPIIVDLALAETDEAAYVVLLQSTSDERETLREEVFLPAVEALALTEEAEPVASYEDPSGLFSVPIPTNWTAEVANGYGLLTVPDEDIEVYVAAIEAESVEEGIEALWEMVDPEFDLEPDDIIQEPTTRGEDEALTITYDTGDDEQLVLAGGWLVDGTAYVVAFRSDLAVFQRRQAQLQIITTGYDIFALEKVDLSEAEPLPLSDELLAELEAYIVEKMEELEVPGVAIAIVQGDEIVYAEGFGVSNLETEEEVTPETLMMIGSSTKSLTTMLMGSLVDEGVFDWDTPVVEILPSFEVLDPDITEQITMRNLVCACTGVPRRDVEWIFNADELTAEGVIESLATFEFFTDFGEAFQYSNQMVAAAGYIAALAAGGEYGNLYQAYVELMQERILDPMEMSSSTFSFDEVRKEENHATPYTLDLLTGEYVEVPLEREELLVSMAPAGSMWSNVLDMGNYLITELNEGVAPNGTRVISAENLAVTWEPQIAISSEASYGLGWIIDEYKGLRVIHHSGNTLGFTSALAFMPDIDIGISVLTNQQGSLLNEAIRIRLLELLFEQPMEFDALIDFSVEQTERALEEVRENLQESVDVEAVEPFLGTYTHPALGQLVLELEDGKLMADAGEFRVELVPHLDDEGEVDAYVSITSGLSISFQFEEDESGEPVVVLGAGAIEYTFRMVS